MSALIFDEVNHTYHLAGRELVSVTRVLDPITMLDGINPQLLAAAADLGTKVHKTVHLYNTGTLDEGTLHPTLAQYLHGWKLFLETAQFVVRASEHRVCHPSFGFAGTLDAKLWGRNALWYVDVKTAVLKPRTVGPQVSAYVEADRQTPMGMKMPPVKRACIQLFPAAPWYKFHELKNHKRDWNMFLSCLNVYRWRTLSAAELED